MVIPGGRAGGDGQWLADEGGGVSGTRNTGAWEDTGDPGRHTRSSGAGESREERERNTGVRICEAKNKSAI